MNDSVIWQVLYAILEAIESANKAQRETFVGHYSREIGDLIEGAKCVMLRMTVQSRDTHLQEGN